MQHALIGCPLLVPLRSAQPLGLGPTIRHGCRWYIHTPCAPRHPPALLQAIELGSAGCVGLALHKVIIVIPTSGTDEEGSGEERSRTGAQLLDFGNRIGQGRCVKELLSVEPELRRQFGVKRHSLRGCTGGCAELEGGWRGQLTYWGFRDAILTVFCVPKGRVLGVDVQEPRFAPWKLGC